MRKTSEVSFGPPHAHTDVSIHITNVYTHVHTAHMWEKGTWLTYQKSQQNIIIVMLWLPLR